MAFRTWGKVLLTALGVGALAGAAQLGIAYGLGILRLARTFEGGVENRWSAQLTWVGWFAMVAAIAGAIAAERLGRRHGHATTAASRRALAAVAGLGATAVAPLCMYPARAAQVLSVDPVLMAGLTTGLGAAAGALAAVAVLTHRAISWNVVAITAAGWLLALVSVAPSLGSTDSPPAVRLGVLDPAWLDIGLGQRLAVVTMPALALTAGAVIGAIARWRAHPVMPAAASGAAGPALLAVSYFAAGPGTLSDTYQAAPYWGALLAVGAGALGSVLATVARVPLRGGQAGVLMPDGLPPDRQSGGATGEPAHDGGDAGDPRPDESAFDATAATSPGDRVTRHGAETPVPDRDANYVEWVTALGAPERDPAHQPSHGGARRSLRSSGAERPDQ